MVSIGKILLHQGCLMEFFKVNMTVMRTNFMLEIVCLQVRAPHNSGYCLQVFSSREQQEQSMHLKYVEILAILVSMKI